MDAMNAPRSGGAHGSNHAAAQAGSESWWLTAPQIKHGIEQQQRPPALTAHYQFGDALLHVASDTPRLLEMFEHLYGDCVVPLERIDPARLAVHCVVRRGWDPPFLLMTFLQGAPQDAASAFLPMRGTQVWDSPIAGWRLAGFAGRPILAACGNHVLIHLRQAWEHLPVEYLVNATLTAQPQLVAVHAASLRASDFGILLAGQSESGKTTTSLHLAARGMILLGDEVGLIRFATGEILPFRKTANLRPGPRSQGLSEAVARHGEHAVGVEGATAVRINRLFPQSTASAVPLRAIFFLNGFDKQPSVEPFHSGRSRVDAFDILAGNEIATLWGLPLERRALRLMAARRLLDRLPSWLLTVGPPDDTAKLVEQIVERMRCSA